MKMPIRLAFVAIFLIAMLSMALMVTVSSGQAAVITRFGMPKRVIVEPGPDWRWPPPFERVATVDLRLRTTASGKYSTQMRDGSIAVIEAFALWRVTPKENAVRRYLVALGNNPKEAAVQIRSILGSAIQTVAGMYQMNSLVGNNPKGVELSSFENDLARVVREKLGSKYGVEIVDVGLERLMVPEPIVASTIQAMVEERRVKAQKIRSEGVERAGQIMSEAQSQARTLVAEARTEASKTEAAARREAADIYARSHEADPELYRFMRGLKAIETMMTGKSTLVLKTDSYPLDLLIEGPKNLGAPPTTRRTR